MVHVKHDRVSSDHGIHSAVVHIFHITPTPQSGACQTQTPTPTPPRPSLYITIRSLSSLATSIIYADQPNLLYVWTSFYQTQTWESAGALPPLIKPPANSVQASAPTFSSISIMS